GVLLVDLRLFLRTLHRSLPISTEFVVDEQEGRHVGPAGVRILLDQFLQLVFVHLLPHVGVFLVCGAQRGGVGLFYLPLDVRRPPCGLRREGRVWKHFHQPSVQQPRALRGVHRTSRVRRQRLLIGRLTH